MRAAARRRLRRTALCGALALAGCASAPRPEEGLASGHCWAPAPNLRAAYNRRYTVLGRSYTPLRDADGYDTEGTASWYGWESGSTTAMGTRFNPRAFTAASRQLPLPTCVRVTNLDNGRSVDVLVNDRGPFVDSRIMDLSYGAALALGVTRSGTASVRIVALAAGSGALPDVAPAPDALPAPPPTVPAPLPASSPATLLAAATVQALPAGPPPQSEPLPAPSASSASSASSGVAGAADAVGTATDTAAVPVTAAATERGETALDALIARADAAPANVVPGAPAAAASSALPVSAAGASGGIAPMSNQRAQDYLQTGAFTAQGNALAERDRLRAAGIARVVIVPGMVRGETFWRVQIGPLPAPQPDHALRARLAALGLRGYAVVQQ